MHSTPVNIARSSSIFFFLCLLLVLLTNHARSSDAACVLRKNGALARCHNLEDIKYIDTYELKSLKVLVVGRHLSTGIFMNLTSLRHLDLSNGKLKKVDRGSFNQLRNLRTLDLSNNHLTHLGSSTFDGLKHLQSLNLSRNSLEHIPHDAVALKSLKFLDLSSNNLTCDCKTLKTRDILAKRGVDTSKHTFCSGSHNLKGRPFIEPDAEAVCLFDEQDLEEGMQMDQPGPDLMEGSGEGSGDGFDGILPEDIPEDEDSSVKEESEVHNSTSGPIEMPLTPDTTSVDDGEIFFSEETDRHTTLASKPIETTTIALKKLPEIPLAEDKNEEGSGDDDQEDAWNAEGSGLEGSGTGIVPPITWEGVENETEHPEEKQQLREEITTHINEPAEISTTTTTESGGIIDSIYGFFWGTTAAPPQISTARDVDLVDEQFIPVPPETHETPQKTVTEVPVVPAIAKPVDAEQNPAGMKPDGRDGSRLEKVEAVNPLEGTESADASAAKQSKKGMGSYVVLAVLLGVLAALIGFAAYKGDFCRGGRKRNERANLPDLENGTELKDLRKSLLDNTNAVQPKISSNGSKPETVPLVTSSAVADENKNDEEPTAKFVGTINDASPDPVKPPRKSFSPFEIEMGKKNGTNGKHVSNVPDVPPRDTLVNGKNNRDSLSSFDESPSPSARLSNSRLSQTIPPGSPGAQRVKITLQDNPDSVPKTPLLITRTKAGENLVKTP